MYQNRTRTRIRMLSGLTLGAMLSLSIAAPTAFGAGRNALRATRFAQQYGTEAVSEAALQSMGSYTGQRDGMDGRKVTLDTRKTSLTTPGLLSLMTYVEPASSREERRVGVFPGFHTELLLTLEEYAQIFGSDDPVDMSLPVREAIGLVYDITARTEGDLRVVSAEIATIEPYQSQKRKEVGRIEFILRDGAFTEFSVQKRSRPSGFGGIGFKRVVLDASASELNRESSGLVLRDRGLVGTVTSVQSMRRAIENPTGSIFRELVR